MSKINFPKKQEQRLIPKYLLEYAEELQENHPDPSAEWGGGSGGDTIQAGTGITITTESDDTKTISIDASVVAELSDIPTATSDLTNDSGYITSSDLPDYPTRPFLGVQQSEDPLYPEGSTFLFSKDGLHFSGKVRCVNGTEFFKCNLNALNDNYGTGLTVTGGDPTDGHGGRTISVNASEVVTAGNITTALGYTPSYFNGNYDDLTNKPDLSIYAESADLATVATTGDYDDLLDKPDLSVYAETADLGDCAYLDENELSIDYSQLTNTPTIPVVPTDVSAFNNDAGYITSADLPTNYVTTDTTQNITGEKTFVGEDKLILQGSTSSQKPGFSVLDINDDKRGFLELRPSSGDKTMVLGVYNKNTYTDPSTYRVGLREYNNNSNYAYSALMPSGASKYGTFGSGNMNMVLGVNGYKADIDGNVTLSIPAKTSDLTNDRFVRYDTASQGLTTTQKSNARTNIGAGTSNFSGSYADLTNKPTIPTNTSDLTNDSGFITGINSSDVTTALGFTPYSSSNPDGYITSTALTPYVESSSLATVATTGDYDDLDNKPSIPTTATSTVTASTDTVVSGVTGSTTTVVSGITYTPVTETLVFTYTDNTTATITLLTSSTTVTSATTTVLDSVSSSTATVMTGATVTTTLS